VAGADGLYRRQDRHRVSPDNNAIGKPAVVGLYLLLDGTTGEPQGADGRPAPDAVAHRLPLRRWPPSYSGARGRVEAAGRRRRRPLQAFLARAHCSRAADPRDHASGTGRPANAEKAACMSHRRDEGFEAKVPSDDLDAEHRLGRRHLLPATISSTPLVKGAQAEARRPCRSRRRLHARPCARADDDAIARARVYVDTRAGATKEAGDIVQADRSPAC
jgi:hypothetical protein